MFFLYLKALEVSLNMVPSPALVALYLYVPKNEEFRLSTNRVKDELCRLC